MRFLSVLAVGLLIAPATIAQHQLFEIHPGSTSYTSRGNLGTGSGETIMGLHSTHWRGLGDNGKTCELTQLGLIDQDQNSFTQESFHLVIRTGDDINGPGTGIADRIARFGPILMPSTPTGSVNAWGQTITFSTPVTVPCDAFYGFGAELTNSTNWAADGMSCHTSFNRTTRNRQYCHMNSEAHGWYFQNGAATATADKTNYRTWRMRTGTTDTRPNLQLGATGTALGGGANQRYGMNGMFPDTGETLSARVTQTTATSTVMTYLDLGYGPGLAMFAGSSRLWLSALAATQVGNSTGTATGGLKHTEQLFGTTTGVPPIKIEFQSAVIDSGRGSLTNGNSCSILK